MNELYIKKCQLDMIDLDNYKCSILYNIALGFLRALDQAPMFYCPVPPPLTIAVGWNVCLQRIAVQASIATSLAAISDIVGL